MDPDWCLMPIRVFVLHAVLDHILVVRFFAVIRQHRYVACSACPILPGYRPTTLCSLFRLSNSSRLSDKPKHFLFSVTFIAYCEGCSPFHKLFCELYQHPERMFGTTSADMLILFNLFIENDLQQHLKLCYFL